MKISLVASMGASVYAYHKLTPTRKLTEMSDLAEIIDKIKPSGKVIRLSKSRKTFDYIKHLNSFDTPVYFRDVQNNRNTQHIFLEE